MISLGLIGCGDVAESGHLPTILNHPKFRLAAVCDIDPARTQLFTKAAGYVPAYAHWKDLLAHARGLDGVVLALPPEVSPDVVVEALRLKLAVLDEKPLAASIADGRRVQRAVETYGGVYQIGFVLRYGDWVEKIRQAVPRLGTPLQMRVEIYDEVFNPADLVHLARIQSFINNSSAMTHEGSHVIDYASLWSPAPWQQISAVSQQTNPNFSGPNVWNAEIELADRSTLSVKVAWLLHNKPPSNVTLVGPEGRIDFDCTTGRGVIDTREGEQPFEASPLAPNWGRQYQTFAEAIERGYATIATVYDGLRALEATLACERSARTGGVVVPADLADQAALSEQHDPVHDHGANSGQTSSNHTKML
jgi:predicted dehydrogenase